MRTCLISRSRDCPNTSRGGQLFDHVGCKYVRDGQDCCFGFFSFTFGVAWPGLGFDSIWDNAYEHAYITFT